MPFMLLLKAYRHVLWVHRSKIALFCVGDCPTGWKNPTVIVRDMTVGVVKHEVCPTCLLKTYHQPSCVYKWRIDLFCVGLCV